MTDFHITPAVIYFPPGNYRITSPIIPFYFTSLVGDFNSKPHLVADPNFNGIAVIERTPMVYIACRFSIVPQNFFRSVRNFVIDTTQMPANEYGTGIHWQVGQATSIINVDFLSNSASGTMHQGIYMENGSGGFMSDLTFTGGAFGMWVSNQQFTIRNVVITGAVSAIYQEWNCDCSVGFDLHTGGLTLATQSAGGVLILDSQIQNTGIGVRMSSTQPTSLGGSVILDNVDFSGISTANIQDSSGTLLTANISPVRQWFQGNTYSGESCTPPTKASALLGPSGKFFTKSRPQYNLYASTREVSEFLSVKSVGGAVGNGVHDDTEAINNFLIIDSGVYLVSGTITVPAGAQIVGDMYPTILGSGAAFQNQASPTPVLKISELVISTTGGSQGAVGIEWNVHGPDQGDTGMWDVHVRLGGTDVQLSQCPTTSTSLTSCATAFIGFHIGQKGSGYFENIWVWNADHDLDAPSQGRINAFSARGILSESISGPVWLVGTASEHHVLYQYSFLNTQNVYAGLIQTETPYFQPTPVPPAPFSIDTGLGDPAQIFNDAWALVITNSANIFIYGAGLYSFFQACVTTQNCQTNIALIDSQSAAVYLYQLTTTGTVAMLTQAPSVALINATDNVDGYASTATFWGSSSATVPPPYSPPVPQTPCTQASGWVTNWGNYLLDNYFQPLVVVNGAQEECGCFPKIPEEWEEPVSVSLLLWL
ncbi:glycoside hydrolase family 55 protein [Mycena maculata]|uniref:Glycoside hydrolase family 55 protein n=1 Tax=Mycena maculata TaxID=230809 RepID=A0AAD7IA07_9AGAR|nr:glycoside hydrolase family 55 protein [Mycena maculata]